MHVGFPSQQESSAHKNELLSYKKGFSSCLFWNDKVQCRFQERAWRFTNRLPESKLNKKPCSICSGDILFLERSVLFISYAFTGVPGGLGKTVILHLLKGISSRQAFIHIKTKDYLPGSVSNTSFQVFLIEIWYLFLQTTAYKVYGSRGDY